MVCGTFTNVLFIRHKIKNQEQNCKGQISIIRNDKTIRHKFGLSTTSQEEKLKFRWTPPPTLSKKA